MTVANNTSSSSAVIVTGITISRETVPVLAKRLASNLFYMTKDHYRYMSDASGEKDLAVTIGDYMHVILNQMNVDSRDCRKCGDSQQKHDRVGGYCTGGNGEQFEP